MRFSVKILLIFLLVDSCNTYSHKGFTYRSNGKMTGIGNKIRLNGYYLTKVTGQATFEHWVYCNDTFDSKPHIPKSQKKQPNYKAPFITYKIIYNACSVILFYEDGSFASDWLEHENKEKAEKSLIRNNLKHLQWGRYILDGDTVKTQFFHRIESGHFSIFQTWYVIKNDSTLSLVKSICKSCKRKGVWENNGIAVVDPPHICHFVPFSQKPDSLCWLKEKKWYSYK